MMTDARAGLNGFSGKNRPLPAADTAVVTRLLSPEVNLNRQFPQQSVTELFTAVRNDIRFEPYAGIQRGATGTALVKSGNSLDQSLLLFALLKKRGYRVRLVEGELNPRNIHVLLRGLYPPRLPTLSYADDYAPYHPEKSVQLGAQVKIHYWVEVDQGTSWLPLDPSFPRAKAGESYARSAKYFDGPPRKLQQRMTLRLLRKTRGHPIQKVYEFDKPVSELIFHPILLSCTGTSLTKPPPENTKKGSVHQLFGGALSGKSPKIKPPETQKEKEAIQGIMYGWKLYIPEEGIIQKTYAVKFADKKTFVEKEWLEFELHIPGQPVRRFSRILFQANDQKKPVNPEKYRRFNLGIFAGAIAESQTKTIFAKIQTLPMAKWQDLAKSATRNSSHADFTAVSAVDASMNLVILHSALLRFAASSDMISDQTAYANGVAVIRPVPRVLISSVDSEDGRHLKFNLDLRLDEVTALPIPGAPEKLSSLYQQGRGISESVQEGKILKILTGKSAITTALVMKTAADNSIPLKIAAQDNLSQFGLPDPVLKLLHQDLKTGWNAIIPARAVSLAGTKRWGWWLLNPQSGRIIGKMDDQLNSAMTEYTLGSKEVGLNPNMGFMVGMIVGADSTLFSISSGILKYGEVSTAMIKEVREYLKSVTCMSCPEAEAKMTAIDSSVGGDCFKKDISSSAKVSSDFCSKYADGFKCAAGMLLSGLAGDKMLKTEIKVGEASVKAGCAESKTHAGTGNGSF